MNTRFTPKATNPSVVKFTRRSSHLCPDCPALDWASSHHPDRGHACRRACHACHRVCHHAGRHVGRRGEDSCLCDHEIWIDPCEDCCLVSWGCHRTCPWCSPRSPSPPSMRPIRPEVRRCQVLEALCPCPCLCHLCPCLCLSH